MQKLKNNKLRPKFTGSYKQKRDTVEPRFNEPLFNELLVITNNIFRPEKSYSKLYGTEPRFNEPRFNEPTSAAQA